jgi:hypothetical protein
MARQSSNKPAVEKPVRTDEKGKVISWNSNSKDGQLLRLLMEQGHIKKETASQVMKDYPQFEKYALRTLSSALSSNRKALEKEVDARRSNGHACEWLVLQQETGPYLCFYTFVSIANVLFLFRLPPISQ